MHPVRIVAELRIAGWTYFKLAEACGVSDTAVYNSIYGRPFTSKKVRMKIVEILGRSEEDLWPERDMVAA